MESADSDLPQAPGVYALILALPSWVEVRVGSAKSRLSPGLYVYVGSARGSGGLRARVSRHVKRKEGVKWHVDQLTLSAARVELVVYAECKCEECALVPHLEARGFAHLALGFGSSDCRRGCTSHLLSFKGSLGKCAGLVTEAFRAAGLKPEVAARKR